MKENKIRKISDMTYPILFIIFFTFIFKYIIPDFAIYQKIVISGLLVFYWFFFWKKNQSIQYTIIELGLASFIFIQIFRSFFIKYPAAIWPSITHLSLFLGLLLILRQIPFNIKKNEWYWAIHLSCMLSLLPVGIGFIKILFQGDDGFNFYEYQLIKSYTKTSFNFLASILALNLPFLFASKPADGKKAILSYLLIFCCLFFILLLNSRGVTICVILLLIHLGFRQYTKVNIRSIIIPSLFFIVISIFITFQIEDNKAFLSSYNPMSSVEQSNNDDRMELWIRSIKLFKEKPIFGHGLGSWKIENLKYGLNNIKKANGRFFYYSHAHNFGFELLAEAGILGFLLFILMVVYPLYISFVSQYEIAFQLLLLISGFTMVYGFFYEPNEEFMPQFLIWAFALSRINFKRNFSCKLLNFISVGFLCMILFFTIWSFIININLPIHRKMSKSMTLEKAKKLEMLFHPIFMNYRKSGTIKRDLAAAYWKAGEVDRSMYWSNMALKDNPYSPRILYELGVRNNTLKQYKLASSFFVKALELNKELDTVRFWLAKNALNMNDWSTYDYNIRELEHKTRQQLERFYTEELLESGNANALAFIKTKCNFLDRILNLRANEQKSKQR